MSFLTSREALTYAVSRELVEIYVVVLVGLLLQIVGTDVYTLGFPYVVSNLLRFVFTIVGFVVTFVGTVALLFKLIADGTART